MKIGNVEIAGHVVLGPMAGITCLPYREFMKGFGVGLSVSEMISDCGLSYGNKKTMHYADTSETDRPVALQLFGFDEKNTIPAIGILEREALYDILDLNFGCPVTKVVKTGAGSAWMRHPQELEEYVKAVVGASHKPVTAKIRLGFTEDEINAEDVAFRLQRAGVSAITVHCRTRSQGYSGKARYEVIEGLGERLSVPLIVSGDIFSAQDAKRALDITKGQMVMVARGGVGHPFLITQINHYLDTGELLDSPSPCQQIAYAKKYAEMMFGYKGERVGLNELRGILPHFLSGFPGYKAIRNQLACKTSTKDELFALLDGLDKRLGYEK